MKRINYLVMLAAAALMAGFGQKVEQTVLVGHFHNTDDVPEYVILFNEDTDNPHQGGTAIPLEDGGGTEHKHRAHHQQKEYREHPHDLTGLLTQVFPDNLRTTGTTVTHGEHTSEIVMYTACKDTSQYNPQVGNGTELGAHDSTEDWASTCDV